MSVKGRTCVWHTLQNNSKEDSISLAAGQAVAFLKQHDSVDAYLDSDDAGKELPTWINLVVTEPLPYTKNKQLVRELPASHPLNRDVSKLHQETERSTEGSCVCSEVQ